MRHCLSFGTFPFLSSSGSEINRYGKLLMRVIGVSVEDAGERRVFLLTSARFVGKGVEVQSGKTAVLTMKKTEVGRCFVLIISWRGCSRRVSWRS